MSKHYYTYLALGDSYTIGESVPLHESFPYQTVQLLRKDGHHFHAPEIVAKTGWTSFELAEHLLHTSLEESYDFVSLLIGVNNQYRGLSIDEFRKDFVSLLHMAIHLCGGEAGQVTVVSIPDWGVTPFASGRDHKKISEEIDAYNVVCKTETENLKAGFINITDGLRTAAKDKDMLAADHLHYSGKAHGIWAAALKECIRRKINN